jgi:hypothetical protein
VATVILSAPSAPAELNVQSGCNAIASVLIGTITVSLRWLCLAA